MRRKRTIYFEDARHYYLYLPDPPITMEQAWLPVDQVSGTGIDTFIYGVACGGLFYPSRFGKQFCELNRPFKGEYSAAFWKAWTNMQSLIERGLNPLRVLIDRAHEKHMDFIASLRMGVYDGMDQTLKVSEGGGGFADPRVRDQVFSVLEEVAVEYPTEGVELDFTAAPGALDWFFRPGDEARNRPVMTEYVGRIANMVHGRPGAPGVVGARVYPTEQMNLDKGLDPRTWLKEGFVDFVVPVLYQTLLLDPDMPIDWAIGAAHESDASIYGFLQPDFRDESRRFHTREHATPEMLRAAASNFIDRGVDGLYTWFLPWPLGDGQRGILAELGDPNRLKEGNKHYFLRRRDKVATEMGYDAAIPLRIKYADLGKRHSIPFYVSDDIEGASERVSRVLLRLNIFDIVGTDKLTILLNGESLAGDSCLRSPSSALEPYYGQWLEFRLKKVLPRKGDNVLQISLDQRPAGLEAAIQVEDVEVIIEYA